MSKFKVGDVVRVQQSEGYPNMRFAGITFVVSAVYGGFAELTDATGLYIVSADVSQLVKVKQ